MKTLVQVTTLGLATALGLADAAERLAMQPRDPLFVQAQTVPPAPYGEELLPLPESYPVDPYQGGVYPATPGYPMPGYPMAPAPIAAVPGATPDAFYSSVTPYQSCPDCNLYANVRYRQLRNAHPNAVEMIVDVPDPSHDARACCPTRFVKVKICVPPCEVGQIRVRRNGRKWTYDFGKYKVDVVAIGNRLVVDYDD